MDTPTATPARFTRDVDLAARYRVSRNSIWRWSRAGRLPAPIKLTAGCTRWNLDDIEKWESEKGEQA